MTVTRLQPKARPAEEGAVCDCARPAVSLCGTGGDYPTVVHCLKPVCRSDGNGCKTHRHRHGTMAYGAVNTTLRVDFGGFFSIGGPWEFFLTFLFNRMPAQWKMNRVLRDLPKLMPPPAPLPSLVVLYRGRRFYQTSSPVSGDRMVEDTSYRESPPCAGNFSATVPGLCGSCGQSLEAHRVDPVLWPSWAKEESPP